jgi:hypothetical protein
MNDGLVLAPPPLPRSLAERVGYLALRLSGWHVVGIRPTAPKFLIIVAHRIPRIGTSWWDSRAGPEPDFSPAGPTASSSSQHSSAVRLRRYSGPWAASRLIAALRRTRCAKVSRSCCGKSITAAIPVVPVYFDHERRECRIGPAIELSNDPDVDLEVFRQFSAGVRARHPERFGPIRF